MAMTIRWRSASIASFAAALLILGTAQGLAAQINGSALLTRTGDGHTSIYTSECAKSAMDAFLIERRSEANPICEG